MTKTSPTKPKPKPRQELIELAEDSGAIFQAVGILPCDVAFEEQGASISDEITRIKQTQSPTIAKRTNSRYRSVVQARLGANHPSGPLLTWE